MSEREFVRAAILRRVVAGELTLREATLLLGVSYGALRVVHVARDGHERVLRWTEASPRPERRATTVAPQSPAPAAATSPRPLAADHPWQAQHARWSARGLARRAAREARAALPATVKGDQ